jgi:hypothetical protein
MRFEKPASRPEPGSAPQVSFPHLQPEAGGILMRTKLALSALVIAALFGATTIAPAQTQQQPAPGASSESTVGANTTHHSKMKYSKMKSSKAKSGTTTGMSSSSRKGNKADKNDGSK